ncbi:hypothetical protein LRS06_24920 [Hymenobacter sp. J193]|uniref:hypothetical protein n=1 Tax=Hymenobacter sp. J193 TaxID=2898429 RepID=UPI002150BB63|nr:hypothetical protein [Hymenobacter sp. J193]MCR5890969.1 hypothetical protein [Hymenobacter sp. J193]
MPAFKPAKIESRRGRIPVSEEARQEARAGMGGEQTARATGIAPMPVAPAAAVVAVETPAAAAPQMAAPVATVLDASSPELLATAAPLRRPRAAKVPATPAASPEQEHSVKLPRSVVQQIKLSLALLPDSPENPSNIKQYLELAHRVLDAQLRKTGKLPPAK